MEKKDTPKLVTDARELLKAATVRNLYVNIVTPNGDLVRVDIDRIKLGASVERGVYVEGLKPGHRLAQPGEAEAAEALGKKKPAAGPEECEALRAARLATSETLAKAAA